MKSRQEIEDASKELTWWLEYAGPSADYVLGSIAGLYWVLGNSPVRSPLNGILKLIAVAKQSGERPLAECLKEVAAVMAENLESVNPERN